MKCKDCGYWDEYTCSCEGAEKIKDEDGCEVVISYPCESEE